MRRLLAIMTAAVLLVGVAACGDDDEPTGTGDTTSTAAEATTTSDPGDGATTTAVDGIDPMEDAGTDPVHQEPSGEAATSLLTDVRVARHEGFDRVVFEFDGPVPGFDVEYVQPPITEDGSGDEIEVDGDALLSVTMQPASGFDLSAEGGGEQTYEGPTRIAGVDHGTSVIREVVRSGDFEAILGWVIGISDRVDFRVDTLTDPSRLVIDVRNH